MNTYTAFLGGSGISSIINAKIAIKTPIVAGPAQAEVTRTDIGSPVELKKLIHCP